MTTQEFEDGTLAWKLIAATSSNEVWGQLIGTDKAPVFYTEANKLYQILYSGDYTATVYCNGATTLPVCEEKGQVYTFTTSAGQTFTGQNITQDVSVTVTKQTGYAITIATTEHGAIETNPATIAAPQSEIAVTVTPDTGYRLKDGSLKAFNTGDEITVVTITADKFTMPEYAVTLTAMFELAPLDLADQTITDNLTISKSGNDWTYKVGESGTPIPFDGTITGTLAEGKSLTFDDTCNGELTLANATIPTLTNNGAIELTATSTATITAIQNTGVMIARKGASIESLKPATFGNPQNGTLTVKAGNIEIANGDLIAEGTKLDFTVTPNTNYTLKQITVNGTAVSDNSYTVTNDDTALAITAELDYNPPYVPPVTYYYTVTLPAVEGVATNPKAGDYTIEEGYSFSFTITLAEGYTQSTPIVKANGQTVTPRTSDGKYTVRHIYEDTAITIEGITPDTPTANAEIESGTQVYVREGVLHIRLDNARKAAIVNAGGHIVRHAQLAAGENRIEGLPGGIYFVQVEGEKAAKVMVR